MNLPFASFEVAFVNPWSTRSSGDIARLAWLRRAIVMRLSMRRKISAYLCGLVVVVLPRIIGCEGVQMA